MEWDDLTRWLNGLIDLDYWIRWINVNNEPNEWMILVNELNDMRWMN